MTAGMARGNEYRESLVVIMIVNPHRDREPLGPQNFLLRRPSDAEVLAQHMDCHDPNFNNTGSV
jgi:hypothetical protein